MTITTIIMMTPVITIMTFIKIVITITMFVILITITAIGKFELLIILLLELVRTEEA